MARSRNIKPGFFVNIELGELEPIARLLFIGLWTIADREGRLKDQPKKIKIQVLPYDDCDIDKLLNQLQDKGFILRYEAENCPCIQIINFNKHQNPHIKEQASELPTPDKHHARTMHEQEKHGSCPADSLNLIPDSCSPRTDSGSVTKKRTPKTDNNGENKTGSNIYQAFSQNIHPITPMEYDALVEYVERGLEEALVIWAIKQAVIQGKRNAKYITAILTNLQQEGIATVEGAEARERDRGQDRLNQPGKAREPTKMSSDQKKRIAELNKKIAEAKDINNPAEEGGSS